MEGFCGMVTIIKTSNIKSDHDSRYFYLKVGKHLVYIREALPGGYPPPEYRALYELLKETARIVNKYNLNDITYTDDDVVGILSNFNIKNILKKLPKDTLPLLINEDEDYREAIGDLLSHE